MEIRVLLLSYQYQRQPNRTTLQERSACRTYEGCVAEVVGRLSEVGLRAYGIEFYFVLEHRVLYD